MTSTPGAVEARPEITGRSVSRPRLAARIRDALDSGSVIITAGAGSGKTTALEQALEDRPVAWLSCSEGERAPGALLMRLIAAIADAVPGASDVFAEQLATGIDRVDPAAATRELIAELSRLLIDPLFVVIDDAEHLEGAEGSLRLVGTLIRANLPSLHLALASRRVLELRVAKPRAAGQVTDLTATDLTFDSTECAALLRARAGTEPDGEIVDRVMEATEGWPLGVALAADLIRRTGGGPQDRSLEGLASAPDVQAYLAEELLESLDEDLRRAALDLSLVPVISPQVVTSLGLPEDVDEAMERAGVLLRRVGDDGSFAYHPLLREFLLEKLQTTRSERERRRLHAAVAPALQATGDSIGAIEHWLAAERWPEAVDAIEEQGPKLLRTSPELLTRWLGLLPERVRELPAVRMLKGQLQWGAGQHEQAVAPLRESLEGYREANDPEHEWLARFFLAEALFSAGPFEAILELGEGWDSPDAPREKSMGVAGVAWYSVLALTALGRRDEAETLSERLRQDRRGAAQFRYLADLATLMDSLAAGGAEDALVDLAATIRELQLNDPQSRLAVSLSVTGLVHLDIGEVEEALRWFGYSRREADRLGLGFIARDAHLQRSSLLARRGDIDEAQLALERAGSRQGTGWRGVSRPKAEAFVASARGDREAALAAAERALTRVRPGLVCFRVWAALDMAIVLAENGSVERARRAIADALETLNDRYPGELGSYHRARLLAARAWLEYEGGHPDVAYENLRRCWEEAGGRAHLVARAQWAQLKPILSAALEENQIAADQVLPALIAAIPRGEALVEFTDHPHPTVRRAALLAALAADHPDVLSELPRLGEDADPEVASAAIAARERLRRAAPPLKFRLLGPFRVSRSGREIPEAAWGRPIDTRLVRFMAVHAGEPMPEDLFFESLWPELNASSARRSLQVAVSRARKVLDLSGCERSVIESTDRSYRLALQDRDAIDAEEFLAAARTALAEPGGMRRDLVAKARSLWRGEPLPEDRYADWAAPYCERLLDTYIALLTGLIQLHERAGEHARSADIARELVDLDPLNEQGHRALMTAYSRTGRRGHALRQYLECRRALVDSLGIEPAEETSRLQARILAGEAI